MNNLCERLENLNRETTTSLDLSNLNLENFPDEIFEFKNLEELDLDYNEIEKIPKRLEELKKLKKLNLIGNSISLDQSEGPNISTLVELNLNCNFFGDFPNFIFNFNNLEKLSLDNCRIYDIPDEISNLKNLKYLNLGWNNINKSTESIGKLINLQELNLSGNKLKTLPKSIGNLINIQKLVLCCNQFITLPESMGKLINLKELVLFRNNLRKLPKSMGKLGNLQELDLSHNDLKKIPEFIGKLINLQKLNFTGNNLKELPVSILELKNLEEFNLSSNYLEKPPESIDELQNLNELDLSNNLLISIPDSIRNVPNLVLLNLTENPNLVEYGEGENLGRIELQQIFGDRVVFESLDKPKEIIDEKKLLGELNNSPIHWNLEILKEIKIKEVEKTELTETQMIEIVDKAIAKDLISSKVLKDDNGFDYSDSQDLINYIKHLYNPEEEYKRWKMIEEFIPLTINLLGYILNFINEKIDDNKLEDINFSLGDIAEGIRFCPDRQMAELRRAYSIIKNRIDREESILDEFIFNTIAIIKERIFDMTITPAISPQNVHVLNYWKYELKDTLGLYFNFKSTIDTMNQDPFDGHRGNALQAFFKKFTPEYVIKTLTQYINDKKEAICKLMEIIDNDFELSDEQKIEMGVDIENGMSDKISDKAVEYFLVKNGILIRL